MLCRILLSGLVDRGLCLNYLLLDVSPPSVCQIIKSGFSDSLSGETACYILHTEKPQAIKPGEQSFTFLKVIFQQQWEG